MATNPIYRDYLNKEQGNKVFPGDICSPVNYLQFCHLQSAY